MLFMYQGIRVNKNNENHLQLITVYKLNGISFPPDGGSK